MKNMKIYSLITLNLLFSIMMMLSETPLISWIMMEISNMFFMMMFTLMQNNFTNAPALLMLIQFLSSTMILMGIIEKNSNMISLGILIKLSMAPAHNWMPMIIYLSPWNLNMLTMTMSKIPPFLLLDLLQMNLIMSMSICMTALILSLKLIMTTNNKIIMALSSILHSSWMVLAQMVSFKIWMLYFFLYSLNTIMICSMLTMNMLSKTNLNTMTKVTLMMMLFSTMGTPPLTMFISKMFLIYFSNYMMTLPMMALIISTAISIMYYSRIFTQMIFMYKKNNKIIIKLNDPINLKWVIMMMIILMLI